MDYNFREYVDQRINELIENEGYNRDGAEKIATDEWNELTNEQIENFKRTGFIEREITDKHPVIQGMKRKEEDIKKDYEKKDFYGGLTLERSLGNKIKVVKTMNVPMSNDIGLLIPRDSAFVLEIDNLILLLQNMDSFNNGKSNILNDLRDIKEGIKK